MVSTEIYGKAEQAELTSFNNIAKKCEQLASGLRAFSGTVEKNTYITKIDQAITLIDAIYTLKADLEADKTTLQAS